jgi:hypothetical protein
MADWDLWGVRGLPLPVRLVVKGVTLWSGRRRGRPAMTQPRPYPGSQLLTEYCDCYDQAYFQGRSAVNRTGVCNGCGGDGVFRTMNGSHERCTYCRDGVCAECGGSGFRMVRVPA